MAKSIMIKKEKFYSFIWFVPVIAVCIAASLVYSVHFDKGPMITLILTSADGIEAGKTAIKARSVEIGKVKSISLASDLKSVIALVQMNEDTEYLLNEDTKFWIEKPRVDRKGVSGLSTILSGYYIELAPGSSTKLANKFTVLDDPPANMNADGLVLSLVSKSNKKITVGDTVRFKGMDAGMVITADYDFNNHNLVYSIVINPPFNKIVTNQSRFWISSGISVTMGAEGFHINTDSLESIISGGISFDTPNLGKGYYLTRASSGQTYTLYDNYDDISNTYDSEKTVDFIVLLNKPPKGLVKGSPVYYSGVQVGIVKEVPYFKNGFALFYDKLDKSALLISIQMQRFEQNQSRTVKELREDIINLIKNKNLTATIEMMNVLTQRNMISLYEDKTEKEKQVDIKYFDEYVVIPSKEIDLSTIQNDISTFAHNLSKIKVDEVVDNINNLLNNYNKTAENLSEISKNINIIVEKLQKEDISAEMLSTLKTLQNTLNSYNSDSAIYQDLQKSIKSLNETMNSIKPIVRKIDEKSNSLIFSYEKDDPKPVVKQK